jgi:hypothetical protein
MATKIEIEFNEDVPDAELAVLKERVTKALRGEAVPEVEVAGQQPPREVRINIPVRGPKFPGER